MNLPLENRIADAYAAHQAGQTALAEQRYRAILEDQPEQVDVLYLLSCLLQASAAETAAALARRALESASGFGGIGVTQSALHDQYAATLRQLGTEPAIEAGQLALAQQLDPSQPERLFRLADAERRAGRREAAIATLTTYLGQRPGDLNARTNLGALQFQSGLIAESIASLNWVLQVDPNHAEAINNLGNAHSQQGKIAQSAELYRRAVTLRPEFADAWFNLAGALHTLTRYDEALPAYRRAVELNPRDQRSSDGLNNLFAQVVPRWHFVMMNDRLRNAAYDRAISGRVAQQLAAGKPPLVLDIGAGSGLLSMMAARAGAPQVVACEMVQPVAQKAREIIARNGYSDRVTLHDRKSTLLAVGADLPRRADILVTEIFDAGLLGEYILPVLAHARRNLLIDGAKIVPARARVWMMPIESTEIHDHFYVDNRNACGFDLAAFNEFSKLGYEQILIRRYAHTPLSAPVAVLDFDFSADIPDRTLELRIEPLADGRVHAWVFWFTLYLDDQTEFDTGPFNHDTCWAQAVQVEATPPALSRGVPFSVRVVQTQTSLRFSVPPSAA